MKTNLKKDKLTPETLVLLRERNMAVEKPEEVSNSLKDNHLNLIIN